MAVKIAKPAGKTQKQLAIENELLRSRVAEAEEILRAIRTGEVDALIVSGPDGDQIFTLKQAENALQESEARTRKLIEHLPTVVYMNAVGDVSSTLYVSPQIETLLGYTPQEWMADPKLWSKTLHPEDSQHVLTRTQRTDLTNEPYEMEYRMIARDGRLVWVHDQIVLVNDLGGNPQFWQGIMLDISDRKHAEESLRKSESLLRATGKMAKVGGWEFDVATLSVVWTDEVNEIHEVGPGYEPTLSKMINFYAREATPVITQAMQRAIDYGQPFNLELPINTAQGKRCWVHIMGQAQQSDRKTTKISGTFQDITLRRQGQEALRESESILQGILRSTADGILAVNKEKKVLFANERFIEMWRIPPAVVASQDDSVILQHVLDQLSDPQGFLKRIQDLYKSEEESFDTLYFKDGRVFERLSRPLLQDTKLRGRVWSFRDITNRKRAEEALRVSEERLSQVWAATSDAMSLSDPEGIVLAANPAYFDLYGYTREQVIGRSFSIIFPEGAQEQAIEQYKTVFTSAVIAPTFESVIQRSDGTGRTVEANVTFLTVNGVRTSMLSTIRDISERKQAEDKVRSAGEFLQSVQDALSSHIAILDHECNIVQVNSAWRDFGAQNGLGHSNHCIGLNYLEVCDSAKGLQAEGAALVAQAIREILSGVKGETGVVEYPCHAPNEQRWFVARITSFENNDRKWIAVAHENITGRKQAEARIQRQLEHLTALSTIDRIIAANVDLKLSLSEILSHVTTELDIDAADILLLNPNSQMLEYGAEHGLRTRAVRKVPLRLTESYAGRVVLNRQFIQVQNPTDEPENLFLGTHLESEDFVFYCGVPLITKGQVKGVLEVFHRAPLEPEAEWLDFLQTLSGQAAIAIENSTLFESLQRSNLDLTLAYDATIEGWSRALDLRDKETEGHSLRVTDMTVKLARAFGLSEMELAQVRWGALLHDIGKMGVPDGILLKPGSLTDEEWAAMKKHPILAYEMLSPIHYLRLALDIPYCHHEKWDGTGYPRGLKGEVIPLTARIFSVVDVWDALCSDRPYRARWPEEKVREHIRALSGTHFDPQIVDVFMRSLS